MPLNTTTIRPGLLVGLKTSIHGNVSYTKTELGGEFLGDGLVVNRWNTERTIADIKEHEAAVKVRSKARAEISAVCAQSAFGLLCPVSKAEKLEAAIAAAQQLISDFNAQAKLSHIRLYVITGKVAEDDVAAIRAINSELSDLLAKMQTGLANLDVKAVRDAANRAKSVGQLLSTDAQARVKDAIETGRAAARRIVQAGEQVAQEIDTQAIASIATARTAFLDLDEAGEIAAPIADSRAVDFAPEVTPVVAPKAHVAIEVE